MWRSENILEVGYFYAGSKFKLESLGLAADITPGAIFPILDIMLVSIVGRTVQDQCTLDLILVEPVG